VKKKELVKKKKKASPRCQRTMHKGKKEKGPTQKKGKGGETSLPFPTKKGGEDVDIKKGGGCS